MLTFVMPHADRRREARVPDARGAVQDEWDPHRVAQPGDEREVEGGVTGQHRVRTADGHGERVDAGGLDERPRLVRIGPHTGGVRPVLAPDLAEFGLHPDPVAVAVGGDLTRRGDVVGVRELRGVEHDGGEAEPDGLAHQPGRLGVVEVHGDRHARGPGDGERGEPDRFEGAVVAGGVLADLEDHRQPGGLRPAHDGLRVLDLHDVERPDAGRAVLGRRA